MFINNTQELTPSKIDNIVKMELGELLEDSDIEGCAAVMGLEMPSNEKIQERLDSYLPRCGDGPHNEVIIP